MIENVGSQPAKRLLALEVRSRKIGFAVFEGPSRLLDWGVRSCSHHPTRTLHEVVAKRVRPLLFHYRPFAVVMRRESQYSSKTAVRLRVSVSAIRREANRSGVEIRLVKAKTRNQFFVQLRCERKHQVAQLVGDLFEELSWSVQPQRKAWHSESYHTVIFDAAATGLVAFSDELNPDTVRELIAHAESFRRPLDGAAR
jgi:hypothetical protein